MPGLVFLAFFPGPQSEKKKLEHRSAQNRLY